jgi:hypothetical protein
MARHRLATLALDPHRAPRQLALRPIPSRLSSAYYMRGYMGLFFGNPQNIDGSASDIVFCPSRKGLLWVLRKLGFASAEALQPPPGAYQQLATFKRVMVMAIR